MPEYGILIEKVTPEDAVELSKYMRVDVLNEAYVIHRAFLSSQWRKSCRMELQDEFLLDIGTIYNAGRIQGIREERERRKQHT